MNVDGAHVSLGYFARATRAMGPGPRACVWVRGCSIHCPGCSTPELIPTVPAEGALEIVSVQELVARIAGAHAAVELEGVSFSGGEPFEQASALAEVARTVRAAGLSTLAWSGYPRAYLEGPKAPRGTHAFLAALDVLIDGPFQRERVATGGPLRGSGNQVIHLLTDRYTVDAFATTHLEVALDGAGTRVTGVTDYRALDAVLRLLGAR